MWPSDFFDHTFQNLSINTLAAAMLVSLSQK